MARAMLFMFHSRFNDSPGSQQGFPWFSVLLYLRQTEVIQRFCPQPPATNWYRYSPRPDPQEGFVRRAIVEADNTMPPRPSLPAHAYSVILSALQALPRSEGLRNGTLADWETMGRCMHTLNDSVTSGKAPVKALRNKEAWSKAVDGCIAAALECHPSALQAAISRSDTALLSSIGETLAYALGVTHGCLNMRPAWLRLQEWPHGLQRSVEALIRLAASIPVLSEDIGSVGDVFVGLTAAIGLNGSSRASAQLDEGLLVDLHCAHLKVSYSQSMHSIRPPPQKSMTSGFPCINYQWACHGMRDSNGSTTQCHITPLAV